MREKKLTERDVAALTAFQEIYGEFFSTWKVWENSECDDTVADRLLPMTATLEGRYEALLVMLCSDRILSDDDTRVLGAMRQGLQQLRNAIEDRTYLAWWSSEAESYRSLKLLASHVAVLLRPRVIGWAGRSPDRPNATAATRALWAATSNEFEVSWVKAAQSLDPEVDGAEEPKQ